MNQAVVSVTNVALRGTTIVGRFVLLVAMANYVSPADLGLFSLFSAASLWGVYFQGLEFHLFNVRELVAADRAMWARRTRDAFALYAVVFAGATVVWAILFRAGLMPWRILGWFLAVLACEHVAQESYRLLNVFRRPLAGSLVLFARSGGWTYVLAVMLWRWPSTRDLDHVFWGWTVGGVSSVILAVVFLRDLPWRGLPAVDRAWLRRGLVVALPLLGGSLAFRGIALFERSWLDAVQDRSTLGVYGFYATIMAAIPTLAESGIGAVHYPEMMKAWQLGDREAYRQRLRRVAIAFAAFLAIALPGALVGVALVVGHLREPSYADHLDVGMVLLVAAAVWSAGVVPQYALWARRQDRAMIAIPVIGLATAIGLDVILIPRYAAMGAALGQLGAMLVILALRLFAIARHDRT